MARVNHYIGIIVNGNLLGKTFPNPNEDPNAVQAAKEYKDMYIGKMANPQGASRTSYVAEIKEVAR